MAEIPCINPLHIVLLPLAYSHRGRTQFRRNALSPARNVYHRGVSSATFSVLIPRHQGRGLSSHCVIPARTHLNLPSNEDGMLVQPTHVASPLRSCILAQEASSAHGLSLQGNHCYAGIRLATRLPRQRPRRSHAAGHRNRCPLRQRILHRHAGHSPQAQTGARRFRARRPGADVRHGGG